MQMHSATDRVHTQNTHFAARTRRSARVISGHKLLFHFLPTGFHRAHILQTYIYSFVGAKLLMENLYKCFTLARGGTLGNSNEAYFAKLQW